MFYDRKRKRWRVQVYYRDVNGVRHRKMLDFENKREAAIKEEEMKEIKSTLSEDSKVFEEIAQEYLSRARTTLRMSSVNHYEKIAKTHLLPTFKGKKIVKITLKDIEAWKSHLRAKNYSLNYLKHCYKVLKLIFNYAFKFYNIKNTSLERAGDFRKDPNQVTKKKDLNYWTHDEFLRWLRAIETAQASEPDSMVLEATKTLVAIGYYAGLRKGEINALRLSDYRLHKGGGFYLSVTKSVAQNLENAGTITTDPKSASSVREVMVCKHLREILDEHIKKLDRIGLPIDDPYLVYGAGPLPNTTAEVIKERYEEIAGVHHIRIHDLRHSFVSNLINAGVPIEKISKVCGHSSTLVTFKTYGHLFPSTQIEMMDLMDRYLGNHK